MCQGFGTTRPEVTVRGTRFCAPRGQTETFKPRSTKARRENSTVCPLGALSRCTCSSLELTPSLGFVRGLLFASTPPRSMTHGTKFPRTSHLGLAHLWFANDNDFLVNSLPCDSFQSIHRSFSNEEATFFQAKAPPHHTDRFLRFA
mgnify:CR=1 FL=1